MEGEFKKGYEAGMRDCTLLVLDALGLNVIEKEEENVAGEPEEKTEEPPLVETLQAQKEEPKEPPTLCWECGHDLEHHKPLEAKSCFIKGCDCRGFRQTQTFMEKVRKIGRPAGSKNKK